MPKKKVDESSERSEQELMDTPAAEEMLADAEAVGMSDNPDAIVEEIAASIAQEAADEVSADAKAEEAAATPPRRRRSSRASREAAESEPPAEAPASDAEADAPAQEEAAADDSDEAKPHPADSRLNRIRRATEQTEQREAMETMASTWQALNAARRQNIVLEGKVFSIDRQYVTDPKTNQDVAEAMVNVFVTGVYQEPLTLNRSRRQAQAISDGADSLYSQRIRVTIPFTTEFYRTLPLDMSDLDLNTEDGRRYYIRRQEMMARKFIGQTIPFCITHMERDDGDAYDGKALYAIAGSRRRALPIISRRIFEPRRGASPVLKVGDVVDTKIISVAPHSVQVTCAGVDTIVPNFALTFKYIDDFRDYYPNGATIPMRVQNIRKREDGSYALVLSGREVELEAARKVIQDIIQVGSIVHGTFVQITQREDGRCTAIAWLNDLDVPAFVNTFAPRTLGDTPISGDEANLIVTGFHDAGFVITNCSGTLGSPSRFMHRQF